MYVLKESSQIKDTSSLRNVIYEVNEYLHNRTGR